MYFDAILVGGSMMMPDEDSSIELNPTAAALKSHHVEVKKDDQV